MTQRVVNYTYVTGNPVLPDGSIDVRDGIDNLQSMDVFMNAPEDTYNQRDGGIVKTLAGAIRGIGIPIIGNFTAGCTVTQQNQGVQVIGGSVYRYSGALPKVIPPNSSPETTGGISPAGEWVDVGDASLRGDLASFSGSNLVGYVFSGAAGYKARTLEGRCKDQVSLHDFLIDTDVDSNWSPVLQRALEYLASKPFAERQQLNVPARGEYLFQDPVIWPTNGDVVADIAIVADYVTNTRSNGVTKFTYQGSGIFIDLRKGVEALTEGGIRISGISFLSLTGTIAINAYTIVSSVFEYLSFGGFEIGIKATGWCYYCVFEKCNFFGLKAVGCHVGLLNGTTFDRCRWNKIDALGAVNGAGTCIKVVGGGFGGKLVGCWLEDTRNGLEVSLTPQIELIGCYLEGLIHPVYSADTAGGLSRVTMRDCRQTIWNNNTRVGASTNGGQLNISLIGHRSYGASDLTNISMGIQAGGGTIFMDIQDYRVGSGTPLQLFGYTPWKPQYSGVYDYFGGCRKVAAGVDVEAASAVANELYVTDSIVHVPSGAAMKRDVRSAILTHNVASDALVFSLPYSATESRFITAEVSGNIGSGRTQRFWRGTVMMQSQAGSPTVRAAITDGFLSESLDELSTTRTITNVTPSVVVSGTTVTLKFNVVSGGSAAPFNVTGLFSCSLINNTSIYPLT